MAFLVGNFYEKNPEFGIDEPVLVIKPEKKHLLKAKQDNSYWVIDLNSRSYFDPKKNSWESFKTEDENER